MQTDAGWGVRRRARTADDVFPALAGSASSSPSSSPSPATAAMHALRYPSSVSFPCVGVSDRGTCSETRLLKCRFGGVAPSSTTPRREMGVGGALPFRFHLRGQLFDVAQSRWVGHERASIGARQTRGAMCVSSFMCKIGRNMPRPRCDDLIASRRHRCGAGTHRRLLLLERLQLVLQPHRELPPAARSKARDDNSTTGVCVGNVTGKEIKSLLLQTFLLLKKFRRK